MLPWVLCVVLVNYGTWGGLAETLKFYSQLVRSMDGPWDFWAGFWSGVSLMGLSPSPMRSALTYEVWVVSVRTELNPWAPSYYQRIGVEKWQVFGVWRNPTHLVSEVASEKRHHRWVIRLFINKFCNLKEKDNQTIQEIAQKNILGKKKDFSKKQR